LEWLFAKEEIRTVKNDGTISYHNRIYQLKRDTILKSKRIIVKECIYGNVKFYD
jgi:hypothetical protein